MIVTQSSLQPPRPFLTLSVLVTSPLQLHRPLPVPHAPLSWDVLYPLVLFTSMLFPSSDLRAFPARHCWLPACSPSPQHLPTDTIIRSHPFICFVCLPHC